jgi:hypothetical protein
MILGFNVIHVNFYLLNLWDKEGRLKKKKQRLHHPETRASSAVKHHWTPAVPSQFFTAVNRPFDVCPNRVVKHLDSSSLSKFLSGLLFPMIERARGWMFMSPFVEILTSNGNVLERVPFGRWQDGIRTLIKVLLHHLLLHQENAKWRPSL